MPRDLTLALSCGRHMELSAGIEDAEDAAASHGLVSSLSAAQVLSRPDVLDGSNRAFGQCIAGAAHERGGIVGRGISMPQLCHLAATLDPEPDTETLIETALEFVGREDARGAAAALGFGTGTGCCCSRSVRVPNAVGVGTDISQAA